MFNILVKTISIVTTLSIVYYFDESARLDNLEQENSLYYLNNTLLGRFPLKYSLCCDYECRSELSVPDRVNSIIITTTMIIAS